MELRDLVCSNCKAHITYMTRNMKPALADGAHLIRWSNARDEWDVEILSQDDVDVMRGNVLCGHCFDEKLGDVLLLQATA